MRSFNFKSFILGALFGLAGCLLLLRAESSAEAIDLGGIAGGAAKVATAVKRLAGIKGNLDTDVKNLRSNATTLVGDKDGLVDIRNKLVQLSVQTKSQIDAVGGLIGVVENHITSTQTNIQSTAKNVGEIEDIRKTLN